MKNISVTNDIVPIAEFKAGISKCFKNLQTSGHPLIITQNGKPAGVLLSPKDYDELVYRKSFPASMDKGLTHDESSYQYGTKEIGTVLKEKRKKVIP
jgi:antitoxin YefM